MKTFARSALSIGAAAALLAACGGSQPPIGAPSTTTQSSALLARTDTGKYKVVYSFGAPPDGNAPGGSLIDVGGKLYGTTVEGGSYLCGYTASKDWCGTVFRITTNGAEKVLYRFGAPPDGDQPWASLLDVGGTLYGTTEYGGSYYCGYNSNVNGCGTVFSITRRGSEKVLISFGPGGARGGTNPLASFIEVNGALYSTTVTGGANPCGFYTGGCGTVFRTTTDGTEHVLHSFGRASHGHFPVGSLTYVGGKLYGTTLEGGPYSCRTAYGCGTVFSMTLGGREKVLHIFGKGTDGKLPRGALLDVNGTFYGTTSEGGAHGYGTVFSITPGGTEKVLHSFGGGDEGRYVNGDLVKLKGKLYGTTSSGGAYCTVGGGGCGTVFSITTSGKESVLHSFGSVSDGTSPRAGLTNANGTLYGTTFTGGTYNNGTVFALTP